MTKIATDDYKLMQENEGDADFSPERNKAVIASSIRKYNAKRRSQLKDYHNQLLERTDAAAAFLKFKDRTGHSMGVEEYVGRQELRNLQAQKLLMKLLDKRNKIIKLGSN